MPSISAALPATPTAMPRPRRKRQNAASGAAPSSGRPTGGSPIRAPSDAAAWRPRPSVVISPMSDFDLALSVALGVGLAAATGLRLFLPMLVASAAAYSGHLPLSENFAWLGTLPALILLGVAAAVEILAYYIPGVDNLLDTVAAPAAFVAGTVVAAAVMTDLPPMVKWAAAVIAGGGIAGATQSVTTLVRAKSTVFTGGLGNPVIATAEFGGSLLVSLLALAAPLLTLVAIVVVLWLGLRWLRLMRERHRRRSKRDQVRLEAPMPSLSQAGPAHAPLRLAARTRRCDSCLRLAPDARQSRHSGASGQSLSPRRRRPRSPSTVKEAPASGIPSARDRPSCTDKKYRDRRNEDAPAARARAYRGRRYSSWDRSDSGAGLRRRRWRPFGQSRRRPFGAAPSALVATATGAGTATSVTRIAAAARLARAKTGQLNGRSERSGRRDKTFPGTLPMTQRVALDLSLPGGARLAREALSQSLRPQTPYAALEPWAASTCSATLPVSSAR